jgi:Pin2-interacting protein X1
MLAERRTKQRIGNDPQNLNWANDDLKFGLKLLKKMGWSEGKGLGKYEDGTLSHIKVQKKGDVLGLGADKHTAQDWTIHSLEFSDVLKRLNDEQQNVSSIENRERNKSHSNHSSIKGRCS